MKNLQQELQKITKEFAKLAGKLEKITRELETGKAPAKKTPAKKKAGKAPVKKAPAKTKPVKAKPKEETAFATIMKIINRSKKGVTTSQIMDKTGFDNRKVANIVFKGRKQGKIKTISKGVYLKA